MVVMAYLAGLISTPAAFLAALGGVRWYRRLRRAQADSEPIHLDVYSPPPPPPQGATVLNRISLRSMPGSRRSMRGRRPQ